MGESRFLSDFYEGEGRTDRTGIDGANGPQKMPPVLPKPAHGAGTSPIAYLDPQGIDYRDHSQFLRYHTVDIEPMKRVLWSEGQIESVGLKRALNIVRGHFSTYSEERPLFGKVAGTFWIPCHVRGTVEEGVVASDYQVGAPRQKSTV
jgi:hypothetical protein